MSLDTTAQLLEPPSDRMLTIATMTEQYRTLVDLVRKVLHQDIDYGKIPGTDGKQVLLLPGAEKMATFFCLRVCLTLADQILDWTGAEHGGEPFFYFRYIFRAYNTQGELLHECDASANSWEEKWRYRYVPAEQVPPQYDSAKLPSKGGRVSEFAFAIEKSETTGQYGKPAEYWNAFKQAITDGTAIQTTRKTKAGKTMDAYEMDTTVYAVPNSRIFDQVNTVQAIAAKRAFVRGVNHTVGASQFFTVDMDRLFTDRDEDGMEEGTRSQIDLSSGRPAETLYEGKQRLILELTRGVAGEPVYYATPEEIGMALRTLNLAYTLEEHTTIKQALIDYAKAKIVQ